MPCPTSALLPSARGYEGRPRRRGQRSSNPNLRVTPCDNELRRRGGFSTRSGRAALRRRGFSTVVRDQQVVYQSSCVCEARVSPSLVTIEQFRRLNRRRLEACTEPTSVVELGASVMVHGM